jgi:predicted GTPase
LPVAVIPPELAGSLYPDGIPIREEKDFESLVGEYNVDAVVFSYSEPLCASSSRRGWSNVPPSSALIS